MSLEPINAVPRSPQNPFAVKGVVTTICSFLDNREVATVAPTNHLWKDVSDLGRLEKMVSLHRLDTLKAIVSTAKPPHPLQRKERLLPGGAVCEFGTVDYIAWRSIEGVLHFCNKATMKNDPETIDLAGYQLIRGSGLDDSIPVYESRRKIYFIDRERKKIAREIDISPVMENFNPNENVVYAFGTKLDEPILFITSHGYYFTYDPKKNSFSEAALAFPEQYKGTYIQHVYRNGNLLCLEGCTQFQDSFVSSINLKNPSNKILIHSPLKGIAVEYDKKSSLLYINDGSRIVAYSVGEDSVKETSYCLNFSSLSRFHSDDCYPVVRNEVSANEYGVVFRFSFHSIATGQIVGETHHAIWNPRRSPNGEKITCISLANERQYLYNAEDMIFTEKRGDPSHIQIIHIPTGEVLPAIPFDSTLYLRWWHFDDYTTNSITFQHTSRNDNVNLLTVLTKPDGFKPVATRPNVTKVVPARAAAGARSIPVPHITMPIPSRNLCTRFWTWIRTNRLISIIANFASRLFCSHR